MSFVRVPADRLSEGALRGLIEELVTRDGTDYGAREQTMNEKMAAVSDRMERGEIVVVFDPESETCTLVARDELPGDAE